MRSHTMPMVLLCGTVTPTTDAVLDAVREAKGRRAIRPAETIEAASQEIEGFLVVPEWYADEDEANAA